MTSAVLFERITVVTPNQVHQMQVFPESWVAVRDGKIAYCGLAEEQAKAALMGLSYEIYPGKDRLLLSSFANTHGHLAMTLLRNQADDYQLHDWLFQVVFPREERLTHDIVLHGTRLAIAEMIRSGTGAAADMYYFDDAVAQAALEAGFRVNLCVDVKKKDASGKIILDPYLLDQKMKAYHRHPSQLLRVSMLLHSVYLYEPAIYPQMAELAKSAACPVQVHIGETRKEVIDCLADYGKRPAEQLEAFGFFQTPTIASHCVHLDDAERSILARNQVLAAHCPASNLKLGSGIADLPAMVNAGVKIGIGTDGAASNNSLDLFQDIRLASFLAKGLTGDASVLPASDLLFMATEQGYAGLGYEQAGRIEEGKDADLQIVRTDLPAMVPLGNPVSALVYSCDGSAVDSLMIGGRWLMLHHELKTMDEERVLYDARIAAATMNQ